MAPCYEVITVASAMSTGQRLVDLMKKCASQILDTGGNVRRFHSLGIRPLAVTKRKHGLVHDDGHFLYLCIDTSPKGLRELEHTLRVSEDVVQWTPIRLTDDVQFAKLSRPLQKAAKRNPELKSKLAELDAEELELGFGHPVLGQRSRAFVKAGGKASAAAASLGGMAGGRQVDADTPLLRLQRSRDLLSQGGQAAFGGSSILGGAGLSSNRRVDLFSSQVEAEDDDFAVDGYRSKELEKTALSATDDTEYLEGLGITGFSLIKDVPADVYEEAFQKRGPQALEAVGMAADFSVLEEEADEDDADIEARMDAWTKMRDAEMGAGQLPSA